MENVAQHKPVVRSSEVIGVKVTNNSEKTLGKIYEIVIDKRSGQVNYAVLESGAILGMGGKYFALPWRLLHYNHDRNAFVINIDQAVLQKAPGFDKEDWPLFSSEQWAGSICDYYSQY